MKVIITQRAKNDRLVLFNYNSKISLDYAIRIDKKIRSYINELKHYPYLGRYVPEIPDKRYRERISEKYKTIFIRYIFNAKQDKSAFLENHKIEIFDFFNRLFN